MTMAEQEESSELHALKLGDHVRIKNYAGKLGKIVELRGALGPDGAPVYRVRVNPKPVTTYIELLGNQLEMVPSSELGRMRARRKAKRRTATRKSPPKAREGA
jgi:hypothetical protein